MFSYCLDNLSANSFKKRLILKALEKTEINICYGPHSEKAILFKDDTVRWDINVIILHIDEKYGKNMEHYKSTVKGEQLIIECEKNLLEYVDYEPEEVKLAPGSGWEAM